MWTETNNEQDLITGVLTHGPDILNFCISENIKQYTDRVVQEKLDYPIPPKDINLDQWFIPQEYKSFDIESWLVNQCQANVELERVQAELLLYRRYNMITVLKAMKFIVDTLRTNNVVWGVGRGSSVSSYVLYLIGVHKIDSIKYNLPIEEFFKGE